MHPNLQTATLQTYSPAFENTQRGVEARDPGTQRYRNSAFPLPAREGKGEGNPRSRKSTAHQIGLPNNRPKYRLLSTVIVLTLLSISAPASTITGNLKDLTGANYSTNLL